MTESISLFVIMPYSIGKNRVASSPNSRKIKVFLQIYPHPLLKLWGTDITKQAGGRVLSISQDKFTIRNYLSPKKYGTYFCLSLSCSSLWQLAHNKIQLSNSFLILLKDHRLILPKLTSFVVGSI